MKKFLSISLIILLSAMLFSGCKKDKGDPPALPASETMIIDFSNFSASTKSAISGLDQKGTNDTHWEYAATVAGIWKAIINTTLIIPVTAFKLAIDQDPVFVEEKTWQWNYNVTVASVAYKVKLRGKIEATEVTWKLYVTKEGDFTDFLWIDGSSNLEGTSGAWTINQSPASATALLRIDWTKTAAAIGTVKYTYVKSGDTFSSSYIEYGLTTGALNAFFNVYYKNDLKFSDVEIQWNTTSKNGRVKSADYLEGVWYCWDSGHLNVLCD
jgi:hypothetical protein